MQELDPMMFIAIIQEMLGGFFWPLVFITLFLIFSFIALLFFDKGIVTSRLKLSALLGIPGAIVAHFIIARLAISGLFDAAGPMDWIMLQLVYLGGFVAVAVLVYTLWGWTNAFKVNKAAH